MLLVLIFAGPARANDEVGPLPEIAGLQIGFDGCYKVGLWTPVRIELRGGSEPAVGRVSITVPDGEGVASRVSTPGEEPVRVAPGETESVLLYVRFGRIHSAATVRFETDDGRSVQRRFQSSAEPGRDEYPSAIPADRRLVVCFAASDVGLEEAAAFVSFEPSRQPVVARIDDLAKMPDRWYGYEGVDRVVIATSRPEVYQGRIPPGGEQQTALDRWVRLGGRVLIMAAVRAEQAADPSSPLAAFIPGTWKATIPVRGLVGLENYLGEYAVGLADAQSRRPTAVARIKPAEGRVVVEEGNLPLVVEATRGFGRVTFLAVDLDEPPSSKRKDRGALVARLLDWPKEPEASPARTTTATHLGFSDISGQLRGALDRYPGVSMIPFGVIMAVLVVYVMLVGPVDYWLLRRWNRLGWTWFTFPLLVVVFCSGAYLAAYWFKGTEIRLNQVDLVDVDTTGKLVRGTHWSSLYSPKADTYTLSLRPAVERLAPSGAPAMLAWLGLPGSGLGGMDPRTANPSPWRVAYHFSPGHDRIVGLPMQTWSTRSFTGRWNAPWTGGAVADVIRRDDEPGGQLTNPLNVELDRCLFVFDRWVYDLGRLGPGETISLDVLPERTELKTLLTGLHNVLEERGDTMTRQVTLYEADSVDLPYILRTMMFFEHAGGRHYTHLSNQYQPFVDLSYLLGPDRAMFIGLSGAPAAVLSRGDQPLTDDASGHLTVYRFVLPVKDTKTGEP